MSADNVLSGPVLLPASGARPKQLVAILHGYGANGQDLIALGAEWARAMPDAAFHAPNAPMLCNGGPGFQWFGLENWFNPPAHRTLIQIHQELYDGAARAAAQLNRSIDSWLNHYGLDDSNLALVGFSQGCMMSLQVGLRRGNPCAGIVGYSGFMLSPEKLPYEITSRPPCLIVHGAMDTVVPIALMAPTVAALNMCGVPVTSAVRPGLAHGIDAEGLRMGGQFLRQRLRI